MQFESLVLGTHNQKKKRELCTLLQGLGCRLLSLGDLDGSVEVEETGDTFAENARLKASVQAKHLGRWVLAEDSGLSVDALKGDPGVRSARFAGEHGNDEANNDLLLERLGDLPLEQRTAQFVCCAAIANDQGGILCESHGFCRGRILFERRGTGGFGYDPLFEIAEYHLTLAEMGEPVKSVISHRARAIRKLVPFLSKAIQRSSACNV